MAPTLNLSPGEVHLWFALPDGISDPALISAYHRMMNAEERSRHKRYRFEKHRHTFLVTRALVRTVLSRYTSMTPEEIRFTKNRFGRPELAKEDNPRVRFNISHTDGMVVCAVTLAADVGIDVESSLRNRMNLAIAERFFAPDETKTLLGLPAARQAERFITYWTLKESFIKACGRGLSIPLSSFSFLLGEPRSIGVRFDKSLGEDPSGWHFLLLDPGGGFRVALALRKADDAPLSLMGHMLTPPDCQTPHPCRILFQS